MWEPPELVRRRAEWEPVNARPRPLPERGPGESNATGGTLQGGLLGYRLK